MVRLAEGEDFMLKYLSKIANDYKFGIGVILGQVISQKYSVISLCQTPPLQTKDDKNAKNGPKIPTSVSEITNSWIGEHARQIIRMLPGGMQVVGIFVVSDDDLLNPLNPKLKSILSSINQAVVSQPFVSSTSNGEKLVLQYFSKSGKYLAKTYDVTTLGVQPVDLKFAQQKNSGKWVNLEFLYQLDHVYYIRENEKGAPLRKHIKEILNDINDNLQNSLILFDNDLRDVEEKLENINKKKKVTRGSSTKTNQEISEPKPIQVSIFEKCSFRNSPTEICLAKTNGNIRIVGEVISKLSLNSKVTISDAIEAVKEDIMRSLASRLEMHWDSLTEEELSEDVNSVHEPPRRVLIVLPETNVTISDYLFPGEGPEDVRASLDELWDIKNEIPLDLLDAEGQADISQYYKDATLSDTESEELVPKSVKDSSKIMHLLGVSVALLIFIISIVIQFYTRS